MTTNVNDKSRPTGTSSSNKAGSTDTTNKEYTDREAGKQNVPGVPVGNPVDDAESETAPPRPGADPDKGNDEDD